MPCTHAVASCLLRVAADAVTLGRYVHDSRVPGVTCDSIAQWRATAQPRDTYVERSQYVTNLYMCSDPVYAMDMSFGFVILPRVGLGSSYVVHGVSYVMS